jgi:hypothetical protein
MVPPGSVGATIGKTIFIYVYVKKIFSRTRKPISIKLDINHSWVKRILNSSSDGLGSLQRKDNLKNAKNGVGSFKNLFL